MAYNSNNPNGQATIANSAPVTISSNQPKLPVEIADTQADIHGQLIGVTRITQLVTKFFQQTPASVLNITLVGTGTTGNGTATGTFSTGTGTTASVLAQTPVTIIYSAQYEAWAVLSGAFTTPTAATSYQRLGIYNTIDGFSFGYNGLTFGLWTRVNSVDTFIAQTSWNKDVLNGAATSTFKSNGSPVALIPSNINMYRIRYGWYGAVNTYFEVYAPDGNWVAVHVIRTANTQLSVNMTNPNLPLTLEVSKTASDATNLQITCGGWAAGVTAPATGIFMQGQQTISTTNGFIALPTTGLSSLSFSMIGTWVGTLLFQYSLDGMVWYTTTFLENQTGLNVTQTTTNNNYTAAVSTQRYYRVLVSPLTSGSVTIVYFGSSINSAKSIQPVSIAATIQDDVIDRSARLLGILSASTNTIGKAYITDGTNSVGITSANIGGNETTLDRLKVNASLRMIDTTQAVGSQLVGATGTQAGGLNVNIKNTTLPVTGTFFQTTQPVSGTFFQTTQPVSIATTITADVIDRAARLLGVISPSTNIIGKVGIDQTTQGVTNGISVISQPELVTSGTITTTDIVVGAPSSTGVLLSGTSTAGSYVAMAASGGNASVVIGVTGLTTGTIYYEGSADSTTGIDGNWVALNMKQAGYVNTQISSFTTVNGLFRGNTAGIRYIRMRSVGTLTGTPLITLRLSSGVAGEFLFGSIPTGTNSIGTVVLNPETTKIIGTVNVAGTIPVTGAFFQATQPVSIASMPTTAVTGTFFQTTQPVSIATAVSVTGTFFQTTQPVSGTFFQTTQPVSGAFFQTTQPISIAVNTPTLQAGSTTAVTQATAANLNATIVGTVTANAGTGTMAVSLATNTPTLAAGTNIVGKVGIDQTTPGTTNLVSIGTTGTVAINTALPTGTNTIGAVNIAASQTLAIVTTVGAVTAITNALPTGANTIGAVNISAAQTLANVTTVATVTAVTAITNALPTGANVIGKTSVDQTTPGTTNAVQAIPGTTNGLITFHLVSAASTNPTVLKAAVGQVYGWYIYNSNAAARKVTFHNTAAAPTAGAATFFSLIVPPGSGANVHLTTGISFSAGIAITTTTGLTDTDAVAVALNDLVINIFYK